MFLKITGEKITIKLKNDVKSKHPEKEGIYILATDPEINLDQQCWIQDNKKNSIQFHDGWVIGTKNETMAGFGDIKSSSSSAEYLPHEVIEWKYKAADQWLPATIPSDLKITGNDEIIFRGQN